MAGSLAVTDLTFAVTTSRRTGGTRQLKEVYGTISIPSTPDYRTAGVPISGVTNSTTGAVVAGTALACPGLGFPNELVSLDILSHSINGALLLGVLPMFDPGTQANGTAVSTAHKVRLFSDAGVDATNKEFAEHTDATPAASAGALVLYVLATGW